MNRIPFDPYDFFGYLASGLLVVVGMEVTIGFPHILGQDLKIVDSAVLLLAIYVAGQMIATPAKALLEDGLVAKLLGRPNVNLFRVKKPWVRGHLFPGFYKSFPEQTRKKIQARAQSQGVTGTGEDLFLHVRYNPDILENDKLMAKLDAFINKYGFCRNLSFTSLTVGIGMTIMTMFGHSVDPELKRYTITALAGGVLLFYRYLKFFWQYSYEMFNTYGQGK